MKKVLFDYSSFWHAFEKILNFQKLKSCCRQLLAKKKNIQTILILVLIIIPKTLLNNSNGCAIKNV